MPLSDVLKGFRKDSYGSSPEPEKSEGPRLISLTEEEVKSIQPGEPGGEITLSVSGRLEGNKLNVMSVSSESGMNKPDDENAMAEKVMGMMGQAPVVRNQTMPSPS